MEENTTPHKPSVKTRAAAFFAVLMLVCCVALAVMVVAAVGWLSSFPDATAAMSPTATASPLPASLTPTHVPPQHTATPAATLAPTATSASTTVDLLQADDIPIRDLRALAIRLKNGGVTLPETVAEVAPVPTVGDVRTFWIADDSGETPRQFQSDAVLQYVTPHAYWWVEEGYSVDAAALKESAERFETQTYPTNRAFFGSEWSPGVDGDEHLHVFLGNVPGVAGYYASLNEFVPAVNPYSNAAEIFFINLAALQPGNSRFDGVLAHEFQHMIHWWQDRNEETWVNEGLSELATSLNGFDVGRATSAYLRAPDVQLNSWGATPSQSLPNYGYSYLFMRYFLDRFGEDTLKAVVANPRNGIPGFDDTLQMLNTGVSFDAIFADFLVANFVNAPEAADGCWGYHTLTFSPPAIDATARDFPVERESTVRQYAADYIEIETDVPLTLDFTGDTEVAVVDNVAYSGAFQWYSNRGDDSDMTLTRAVDLRDVPSATLKYQVWFDIEENWDYAYVEISTDGGASWEILRPPLATAENPSGNAYGAGYTGKSQGWQAESVDLTPFAGREILLRFEYITDDAINGPGLTLDDIAIPEIGFFDDVETPDAGWEARGFVRMDNRVPQKFTVQVIDPTEPPVIKNLPLAEGQSGVWELPAPASGRYVLVISAQAAVTTEPAQYRYRLTP